MRLLLSTTALFYSLAMTANAAETMAKDTPDDIQLLVSRLNLDSYKKSIKGLTQFGDRRQGTQRNAKAIDWIEQQLRDAAASLDSSSRSSERNGTTRSMRLKNSGRKKSWAALR